MGEAGLYQINRRDDSDRKQRTAVVITAHNARTTIGATVRAAMAIPNVDLIVVVDDGSEDDTSQVARGAGAATVRHSVQRGRASAMETGVKVAAMRDRADWPARHILFLDADLGDSAVEAAALVRAVSQRTADCAIAVAAEEQQAQPKLSYWVWRVIRALTGWDCHSPMATNRCISRETLNGVMPFQPGNGVDVAITLDLIIRGYSAVEVPCAFQHQRDWRSIKKRKRFNPFDRYCRDLMLLGIWYQVLRQRVPTRDRPLLSTQTLGQPYARLNAAEVRSADRNKFRHGKHSNKQRANDSA